jgi:hypothetical protein
VERAARSCSVSSLFPFLAGEAVPYFTTETESVAAATAARGGVVASVDVGDDLGGGGDDDIGDNIERRAGDDDVAVASLLSSPSTSKSPAATALSLNAVSVDVATTMAARLFKGNETVDDNALPNSNLTHVTRVTDTH